MGNAILSVTGVIGPSNIPFTSLNSILSNLCYFYHVNEGIPEVSITAGSRLNRVFRISGKTVTHLRHVVEPMLHYRYIPEVDQSHLPQLDSRDQVDPLNLLTFELMNRLTILWQEGVELPRYREVASFRLAIDYDINE